MAPKCEKNGVIKLVTFFNIGIINFDFLEVANYFVLRSFFIAYSIVIALPTIAIVGGEITI